MNQSWRRIMCKRLLTFLALSAALGVAGPASAVVCYTVLQKDDTVIYRGYEPPVDLSMTPAGIAARDAMQRRGQYLMIAYPDDCLLVSPSRWSSAGYTPATVDDIVSGMRPFASGAPSGIPTSYSGTPTARTAPAPAAARSGSTGMRSGY
jgi:hypothetical protein